MKILLVEDNVDLQKVYVEGLQMRGLQVSVAGDYEAALVLAKEEQPDVVLLDLLMPKMNGMEVLRTLKSNEQLKDIPVIVLTNITDAYFEHNARELGVVNFLIKADTPLDRLAEVIKSTD
jgi:two-component system alkaline phosphatase synthesis response regulator PhoP